MKRCILDGRRIKSLDDLYDQLAAQLTLPEHFGRNLDALWDLLSTDIEGPLEIVWNHAEESKKALGRDFERVLKVLEEVQGERDDFQVKLPAG